MQALSRKSFCMSSLETSRSLSGAGPSGIRYGLTDLNLSQNGSRLTIRSLSGAKLPIGSTWIVSVSNSRLTSSTWLMHASTVLPLARQAHDPQMALRHEYRTASVPSCSSCSRRIASSRVMSPSCSSAKSCRYASSETSGW